MTKRQLKAQKLVTFPEVFNYIGTEPREAEEIPNGPTITLMAKKAREHHIWIHCGSISEVNPNGEKKYNTTVLLNPEGEEVARYRKLHAFDITLADGTETRESDRMQIGNDIVMVDTELGKFGHFLFVTISVSQNCIAIWLRMAVSSFHTSEFPDADRKRPLGDHSSYTCCGEYMLCSSSWADRKETRDLPFLWI